jgi:hypothetical protein
MYKNSILPKLIIILFLLKTTEIIGSSEIPQSQPSQEELEKMLEGIDEDMLIGMMQEVIEQYSNWSEEEKEIMCKENNIKREDLDNYIEEAKTVIDKAKKETEKTKQKKENQTEKETKKEEQKTPNEPITEKNQIQKYLNQIQKCIHTIETLQLKSQDSMIQSIIISYNEELLGKIEILKYYLKIFYDFLNKYKEENKVNIENKKIEDILNIVIQINELEPTVARLITLEEFQEDNQFEDLFQKYRIKSNQEKELKEKLENEITNIEKAIEKIETNLNLEKKEKKTKIVDLEYKLDIIENDLSKVEAAKTAKKKNNEKLKEFKENLQNSLEKIISKFNNIFEKNNGILKVENFIKEYFPKEYNIGKEKEKIQKEIKKKEEQIANQKGSKSEMTNDKVLNNSNYLQNKKNSQEKDTDSFRHNEIENYEDFANQEEENKNSNQEMDEPKAGKKGLASSADQTKTKEENTENQIPANDEKKNNQNLQDKTKRNKKKETINITENILNEINEIEDIMTNFFLNESKTINNKNFSDLIKEIKKRIEKTTKLLHEINIKQIKKEKIENLSLKKISENKNELWPNNILQKESEKIDILNKIKNELKQQEIKNFENQNLEIFQMIFYKIISLSEFFSNQYETLLKKISTNDEKEKDEKEINELINSLKQTIENEDITETFTQTGKEIIKKRNKIFKEKESVNSSVLKKYLKNNQLNFWTLNKQELENDLAEIKKLQEKNKK